MAAAGFRLKQALMAAGRKLALRGARAAKNEETFTSVLDFGKQSYDSAKDQARQQGASSSRSSRVPPPRQPPLDVDVVGAHPSQRWKAAFCFGGGDRSIGGEDFAAQHNQNRAHNLCGFDPEVQSHLMEYVSSFFDHDLKLMVAVDFTDSNGDSRIKSSLHFHHPSGIPNLYQKTIESVGGPIQMSASDKRFHAWGFGGVIVNGPEQNDEVSHAFNLNGMHEVVGVDGILSAYSLACNDVAQSGPIRFSDIVNKAVDIVSVSQHNYYAVLLIITTGVPTDMSDTIDALVRGAEQPLSVLIVGLGGIDFAELENEILARVLRQNFVMFGSMREVIGGQFLAAIPKHFMSYTRYKRIKPVG